MHGDGENSGICTWIDRYINSQDICDSTKQVLKSHVNIIRERALGMRMTGAKWIRNFVTKHPLYNKDSIVTPEINYDLMKRILAVDSNDMVN